MFEFFKKRKQSPEMIAEKIYLTLVPYEQVFAMAGLEVSFRKWIPIKSVIDLFNLSDDIGTTSNLIRVAFERHHAEGLLRTLNIDALIKEGGPELSNKEVDDYYETAKNFCDEIMSKTESGEISRDPRVGNYLSENLAAILTAYSTLRMKVREKTGFYDMP